MALTSKNTKDFTLTVRNSDVHGENVIFIQGGATVVDDTWVIFNNMRIDIAQEVSNFVQSSSRRLFNSFGDITYVLITVDKTGGIEVIPNISYGKTSFGDIKVFPDLSGKIPLVLVKLQQDGSTGLTGIQVIQPSDIELYQGYGNFTLRGSQGPTGLQGDTGFSGLTGMQGTTGSIGYTGTFGCTGIPGYVMDGETGEKGAEGTAPDQYIPDTFSVNFSADNTFIGMSGIVQFKNLSKGEVVFRTWNFGDSTISHEINPGHIYGPTGSYTVSLFERTFNGSTGMNIKAGYITVS